MNSEKNLWLFYDGFYGIQLENNFKGTVKEKKGAGIDSTLSYFGADRNPWEFYFMFLSREID